ncbi:MAG: DUF2344 domain-containing protein [Clostridia bacterium]|nr:DUF2344 domain-containing protein [Clostridia bacterium]MBQ5439273.1 DUF2344 domain-containing protein [Clostridia bacterium]
MKNIRVWYKKDGACRYISHLDVNRAVMRAMQMSGVPFWHTEGFNTRVYVSFSLPLSLGFKGDYESFDARLKDDNYPIDKVAEKLNACLPEGIFVYDVTAPVMKPAEIVYALFEISCTSDEYGCEELKAFVLSFFEREHIMAEKKTKKGAVKEIDLKENVVRYSVEPSGEEVKITLVLPAGIEKNINPMLLTDIMEQELEKKVCFFVTRSRLYNEKFEDFV